MSKQIPAQGLTEVSTTALEGLGDRRSGKNDGKIYRYVQIQKSDAKRGEAAGFFTSNNHQVTTVASFGAPEDHPAGIVLVDASSGSFTWIQCLGYNSYALTDGGVTAHEVLFKDSAANGTLTNGIDGNRAHGTAGSSDSGSMLPSLFITCN